MGPTHARRRGPIRRAIISSAKVTAALFLVAACGLAVAGFFASPNDAVLPLLMAVVGLGLAAFTMRQQRDFYRRILVLLQRRAKGENVEPELAVALVDGAEGDLLDEKSVDELSRYLRRESRDNA